MRKILIWGRGGDEAVWGAWGALPSLRWFGGGQGSFPSEVLSVLQQDGGWEWHKLCCHVSVGTGIPWLCWDFNAVDSWDPLSWVPKVALSCLCSSPTHPRPLSSP